MAFDFKSYLERMDSAYIYQVEHLTGGVINFTVRASKVALRDSAVVVGQTLPTTSDLDLRLGRFPGHTSLILKHATSHIAELVEATALALFMGERRNPTTDSFTLTGKKAGPLHEVLEQTGVMIPELLHYDAAEHVLILSDLGLLPDLSKVFCELGGYTPGPGDTHRAPKRVPRSPKLGEQLMQNDVAFFEVLGHRLGSFFAELHSKRTRQLILAPSFESDLGVSVRGGSNGFPCLPEMKTVVHEHVIKPLKSQLLLFPSLLDVDEAEALFSSIEADFLRDTAEQERCFVIGDCWTGTVLVDLECRSPEKSIIGIIDWEFANISGRGINGDISQIIAHLELFLIAAYSRGKDVAPGHISALSAILGGVVSAYKYERDKTDNSELRNDLIMRSAFLSHGAELINCAFWKIWVCKETECLSCLQKQGEISAVPPDEKPGESPNIAEGHSNLQCTLITKMVGRGISFLRCAVAEDPLKASNILLRMDLGYSKQPSLVDFFN